MKVNICLKDCFYLSLLLCPIAFVSTNEDVDGNEVNPALVTVKQGKLQGLSLESRRGRKYNAFFGVPYGKSAVRFEPPMEGDSWSGVKLVTERAPHCFQMCGMQKKLRGVEDCLTVNIYSPNLKGNFPVMVFLHGGGYQRGSGNLYDAKYFMDEDVVLVTTQYRLGALGFLNTEDDVVSGNMGLKDQALSLKWIAENIEQFGGNPKKVTIFGQSAGGASVHFHMMSPMSKGLFFAAIAVSGTSLSKWAFQSHPKQLAQRLAQKLECPYESSKEMVQCLRGKSAADIVTAQLSFKKYDWKFDMISMLFCPSVEKGNGEKFLDDTPYNLMKSNRIVTKVPLVLGMTAQEGAYYTASASEDDAALEKINSDWNEMAPNIFYYEDSVSPTHYNEISEAVYRFYFGKDKIGRDNYQALEKVYSDRFFNAAIRRTVLEHAKRPKDFPVYPYIFNYEGRQSFVQVVLKTKKSYGAAHCEDMQYLFNQTFGTPEHRLENEDGQFSEKLVKLYASIARDGKPTSTWGAEKVWQPFQLSTGSTDGVTVPWYIIDKETAVLKDDPFKAGMEFWESLPLKENDKEDKGIGKDEL